MSPSIYSGSIPLNTISDYVGQLSSHAIPPVPRYIRLWIPRSLPTLDPLLRRRRAPAESRRTRCSSRSDTSQRRPSSRWDDRHAHAEHAVGSLEDDASCEIALEVLGKCGRCNFATLSS